MEARPGHWAGWIARILSIPVFLMLIMFVISEEITPTNFSAKESLLFAFFPVGLTIGLAIGWFREGIGAAVGLVSVAVFYFFQIAISGSIPNRPEIIVLTFPAILFLLSWWLTRKIKKDVDASAYEEYGDD